MTQHETRPETEHEARHETDNPYVTLTEVGDDARWAFGGGFDDPLEGVDTAVPDGLDAGALAAVCLALGDESLLLAQTLQRWTTHAPELEEEVMVANVALDLLGQTRLLYARAAAAAPEVVPALPEGSPVPAEDRLAFFRDPDDFVVAALAVAPDADFAALMLRLAALATWRDALWRELTDAPDPVLAAVAARAVAEVAYHREVAVRWVQVLAGGTAESARRLTDAHRVVGPLVAGLGALPTGAAVDPAWPSTWARARERFTHDWASLEQGSGTGVSTSSTGVAADGPVVEQGSGTGVSSSSTGVMADPLAPEAVAWRDEIVDEMQSVARRHPSGRW